MCYVFCTEIPLFHVLNARITFGNLNGTESCPNGVITLNEDEAGNLSAPDPDEEAGSTERVHSKVRCLIDKFIFDLPLGYKELGVEAYERQGGLTIIVNRTIWYKNVEEFSSIFQQAYEQWKTEK